MLRRTIIAFSLISTLIAASPAAAAITIGSAGNATITSDTQIGDSLTVNFDGSENGSTIQGLGSSLKLTFAGIQNGAYLFDYLLTNSSTAPTTSSAVTAFGFNVDPNAALSSSNVSGTFGTVSSGQVSQGYNLEMCFKSGQNNNCAGSPGNQGVALGSSGSGQFSLAFTGGAPAELTLSNYLVRYQAVNGNGSAVGQPTSMGAVPEPSTWAMMLLGFGAVGASLRRNRKRAVLAQIA